MNEPGKSLSLPEDAERRTVTDKSSEGREKLFSLKPIGDHFPRLAWILFGLTIVVLAVSLPFVEFPTLSTEEYGAYVAVASSIILPGMAFLYFFAYSFYKDNFYLFVCLGWLANFVYIFFDTYPRKSWSDFDYSLQVVVISVLTTLPFYVAGFIYHERFTYYRRFLIETAAWFGWLSITVTAAMIYTHGGLSNKPRDIKLAVVVIPIVPYSMTVLWRLGLRLRARLQKSGIRGVSIVPLTFYIYALMQPVYLLRLKQGFQKYILAAFTFALLLKILNSVGLMLVINRDYIHREQSYKETRSEIQKVQAQLEERSALEDLGLLTASIEHDIRNPLQVIGSEITRLKKRLQSQPDIVSKLVEIDEQKQRIFDATTMVPLLRGTQEFFDSLMTKVTINDIANAAIKDVKREMNPQNIYFRFNNPFKNRPIKVFFVKGYGPLLTQSIVNVLKNSVEAIREAKRETGVIDVSINESSTPDQMIEIMVVDNGRGIAPELLPQVKSVFTTRNDRKPNSGLGLFITNRIIEVHRGKLELASKEGIETTVIMLLPKWQDEQHIT